MKSYRNSQTQLLDLEASTVLRIDMKSGPRSEYLYVEWELIDTSTPVLLDSGVRFWHRSPNGVRAMLTWISDVFQDHQKVMGVDMHHFNLWGSGDPF